MAELAETATEVVAKGAEAVAGEATEIAEVSRALSGRDIRFVLAGVGVGLVGGVVIGGLYMNRRLRLEYEKIAEDEIAEMQAHYRAKETARSANNSKPDLDELKDLAKPYAGDDADLDIVIEPEEPKDLAEEVYENEAARGTAPVQKESETKNIFEEHGDKDAPVDRWDQEHEEDMRQPGVPHVIHMDEHGAKGYTETSLTYYAGDDVLAGERDNVFEDQDELVGVANLDKFGHGSNDANLVYVRNDEMGVDFEIIRTNKSFAEEVHGLSHADFPQRHRRPRPDDE